MLGGVDGHGCESHAELGAIRQLILGKNPELHTLLA